MAIQLLSLAPRDIGYNFEKIYLGISSNYPLAKMNLNEIIQGLEKIKGELHSRGLLPGTDSLEDEIRQLDYILERLNQWVREEKLYTNNDAEVFLTALESIWKSFTEILEEIDEVDNT